MIRRNRDDEWMSPDELVTLGFSSARVVMMNEGHDDMRRVPRTRRTGRAILPAAHAAGCRVLAMEALGSYPEAPYVLDAPPERVGYLEQPEMMELVDAALALGWSLVAYEASFEAAPADVRRDLELTNWREDVQAQNLVRAAERFRDTRMLVWCGNAHHCKRTSAEWIPMGVRYAARAETAGLAQAFAIDQLATVSLGAGHTPRYALTPELATRLERLGGTAGFTRASPPAGMHVDIGYDAVILSTDNVVE